jgi:hypothetical protein
VIEADRFAVGDPTSIVRRPLFLRCTRGLGGLCPFKPLHQGVDPSTQRFYLAMLSKHNVAQLCIGTLEERDFRLDLLEGAGLHDSSACVDLTCGAQVQAYPQYPRPAGVHESRKLITRFRECQAVPAQAMVS